MESRTGGAHVRDAAFHADGRIVLRAYGVGEVVFSADADLIEFACPVPPPEWLVEEASRMMSVEPDLSEVVPDSGVWSDPVQLRRDGELILFRRLVPTRLSTWRANPLADADGVLMGLGSVRL